uniref:Uncharacterized protein n=1 Tax=Caenorhabditis japonica TaxID=281687 RepID=A0A8R1I2U6_CAEJA
MIPAWIISKVNTIRRRLDSTHELSEQSTSSTNSSNSTSSTRTPLSRRSRSLSIKKEKTFRLAKERTMLLKYVKTRMDYAFYDGVLEVGDTESEPCIECVKRVGKYRGNLCVHGNFCRYCSYEMVKCAIQNHTEGMVTGTCSHCFKKVTGFTRVHRHKSGENEGDDEDGDENCSTTRVTETTISFSDYLDAFLREAKRSEGRSNRGFESSNSL